MFGIFDNEILTRHFIGIDRFARQVDEVMRLNPKGPNFPPYSIIKVADNKYVIEMALAGFSRDDVEIFKQGNSLTIKSKAKQQQSHSVYQWQGLAMRPFTRFFTLDDNVVVRGATMLNGILKISLERIIPESEKPVMINIDEEVPVLQQPSEPVLLTETVREKTEA